MLTIDCAVCSIPQVSISSSSPSHPGGLGLGLGGGALVKAEPLSPRPPDMSAGHAGHHHHLTATRPSSANSHLSPGGAAMASGRDQSLPCIFNNNHLAARLQCLPSSCLLKLCHQSPLVFFPSYAIREEIDHESALQVIIAQYTHRLATLHSLRALRSSTIRYHNSIMVCCTSSNSITSCHRRTAQVIQNALRSDQLSRIYRDEIYSLQNLLSRTQAGPGRARQNS